MNTLILEWYDNMISINEDRENYEACAYFKTSKESYLQFQDKGSILFRGKRYTPEEILSILKEEKETQQVKKLKGEKG